MLTPDSEATLWTAPDEPCLRVLRSGVLLLHARELRSVGGRIPVVIPTLSFPVRPKLPRRPFRASLSICDKPASRIFKVATFAGAVDQSNTVICISVRKGL